MILGKPSMYVALNFRVGHPSRPVWTFVLTKKSSLQPMIYYLHSCTSIALCVLWVLCVYCGSTVGGSYLVHLAFEG